MPPNPALAAWKRGAGRGGPQQPGREEADVERLEDANPDGGPHRRPPDRLPVDVGAGKPERAASDDPTDGYREGSVTRLRSVPTPS